MVPVTAAIKRYLTLVHGGKLRLLDVFAFTAEGSAQRHLKRIQKDVVEANEVVEHARRRNSIERR